MSTPDTNNGNNPKEQQEHRPEDVYMALLNHPTTRAHAVKKIETCASTKTLVDESHKLQVHLWVILNVQLNQHSNLNKLTEEATAILKVVSSAYDVPALASEANVKDSVLLNPNLARWWPTCAAARLEAVYSTTQPAEATKAVLAMIQQASQWKDPAKRCPLLRLVTGSSASQAPVPVRAVLEKLDFTAATAVRRSAEEHFIVAEYVTQYLRRKGDTDACAAWLNHVASVVSSATTSGGVFSTDVICRLLDNIHLLMGPQISKKAKAALQNAVKQFMELTLSEGKFAERADLMLYLLREVIGADAVSVVEKIMAVPASEYIGTSVRPMVMYDAALSFFTRNKVPTDQTLRVAAGVPLFGDVENGLTDQELLVLIRHIHAATKPTLSSLVQAFNLVKGSDSASSQQQHMSEEKLQRVVDVLMPVKEQEGEHDGACNDHGCSARDVFWLFLMGLNLSFGYVPRDLVQLLLHHKQPTSVPWKKALGHAINHNIKDLHNVFVLENINDDDDCEAGVVSQALSTFTEREDPLHIIAWLKYASPIRLGGAPWPDVATTCLAITTVQLPLTMDESTAQFMQHRCAIAYLGSTIETYGAVIPLFDPTSKLAKLIAQITMAAAEATTQLLALRFVENCLFAQLSTVESYPTSLVEIVVDVALGSHQREPNDITQVMVGDDAANRLTPQHVAQRCVPLLAARCEDVVFEMIRARSLDELNAVEELDSQWSVLVRRVTDQLNAERDAERARQELLLRELEKQMAEEQRVANEREEREARARAEADKRRQEELRVAQALQQKAEEERKRSQREKAELEAKLKKEAQAAKQAAIAAQAKNAQAREESYAQRKAAADAFTQLLQGLICAGIPRDESVRLLRKYDPSDLVGVTTDMVAYRYLVGGDGCEGVTDDGKENSKNSVQLTEDDLFEDFWTTRFPSQPGKGGGATSFGNKAVASAMSTSRISNNSESEKNSAARRPGLPPYTDDVLARFDLGAVVNSPTDSDCKGHRLIGDASCVDSVYYADLVASLKADLIDDRGLKVDLDALLLELGELGLLTFDDEDEDDGVWMTPMAVLYYAPKWESSKVIQYLPVVEEPPQPDLMRLVVDEERREAARQKIAEVHSQKKKRERVRTYNPETAVMRQRQRQSTATASGSTTSSRETPAPRLRQRKVKEPKATVAPRLQSLVKSLAPAPAALLARRRVLTMRDVKRFLSSTTFVMCVVFSLLALMIALAIRTD
eukprot:PhM_4_TR15142/c0_g1_i1/m.18912